MPAHDGRRDRPHRALRRPAPRVAEWRSPNGLSGVLPQRESRIRLQVSDPRMPIPFGRLEHTWKGPPDGAQSASNSGGGDRRSGADLGAGGGHVGTGYQDQVHAERRPGAGLDERDGHRGRHDRERSVHDAVRRRLAHAVGGRGRGRPDDHRRPGSGVPRVPDDRRGAAHGPGGLRGRRLAQEGASRRRVPGDAGGPAAARTDPRALSGTVSGTLSGTVSVAGSVAASTAGGGTARRTDDLSRGVRARHRLHLPRMDRARGWGLTDHRVQGLSEPRERERDVPALQGTDQPFQARTTSTRSRGRRTSTSSPP